MPNPEVRQRQQVIHIGSHWTKRALTLSVSESGAVPAVFVLLHTHLSDLMLVVCLLRCFSSAPSPQHLQAPEISDQSDLAERRLATCSGRLNRSPTATCTDVHTHNLARGSTEQKDTVSDRSIVEPQKDAERELEL